MIDFTLVFCQSVMIREYPVIGHGKQFLPGAVNGNPAAISIPYKGDAFAERCQNFLIYRLRYHDAIGVTDTIPAFFLKKYGLTAFAFWYRQGRGSSRLIDISCLVPFYR